MRTGKNFLKRGGGVGGGNIPTMEIGRSKERLGFERPRSSQPAKKQGIRDLIIDHLKQKITSEEDAQKYLSAV